MNLIIQEHECQMALRVLRNHGLGDLEIYGWELLYRAATFTTFGKHVHESQ